MELKYFETLKTILETGSYASAAAKLNYTQSSLTFQMNKLEEAIGIRLFEKVGRRMQLTEAGRAILPYVNSLLESADRLFAFASGFRELDGNLHVAMAESIFYYLMGPVIDAFHEAAPQVELAIQLQENYEIRESLINGKVDMAICYDDVSFGEFCVDEPFADNTICFVGSRNFDVSRCNLKTPGSYNDYPLIVCDPNAILMQKINEYLKQSGITFRDCIVIDSIESIKRAVRYGLGISALPYFAVEKELQSGELTRIPFDGTKCVVTSSVIRHAGKQMSSSMELLSRLVRTMLSDERYKA